MDTLGGYRLVRRLGVGARSEVWLGSNGAQTVAIKVYLDGISSEHVDAEIEALGRASHRHLMRLDDLAMAPNGTPCMILQRLSQWSLGRLLAAAKPSEGEAVTILAPLCLAVAELHRVGVAHGRIGPGSVLFDDRGAPVLSSFGKAELFGPMPDESTRSSVSPAQLSREPSITRDLDALSRLCTLTLRPGCEVVQWLADPTEREDSSFTWELADRLFGLSPAEPVRTAMPGWEEQPSAIPSRVSENLPLSRQRDLNVEVLDNENTGNANVRDGRPPGEGRATPKTSRFVVGLHVPEGLSRLITEWWSDAAERSPASVIVRRVKDSLKPVRKPVWIVAGIVATCVVAAVAVMPLRGGPVAQPTLQTSPTPEPLSSAALVAMTGDDPVAAASALLDARNECFESLSVLCLDSVDQSGSTAMTIDATQVRMLQEGGSNDGSALAATLATPDRVEPRRITLVERLGDSALVTAIFGDDETTLASYSLLLIKQEAGWRLRDIIPVVDAPFAGE